MERNQAHSIRPYHPSSNGLAERFVQTFIRAMKASEGEGKTLNQRLSQFLFMYWASPQATTNMSPSELFLGQPLRTRFDLLRPNSQSCVILKQADQKTHHDRHCKLHCFTQGQTGMVWDFRSNSHKWMKRVVLQQLGPVMYTIEVDGKLLKWHVDHNEASLQVHRLSYWPYHPGEFPVSRAKYWIIRASLQWWAFSGGTFFSVLSSPRQATFWQTYILIRLLCV